MHNTYIYINNTNINIDGNVYNNKIDNKSFINKREKEYSTNAINFVYKRNKFFPSIISKKSVNNYNVLLGLSLGLLNKNFKLKNSQKTSKLNYLNAANFLKQVLISTGGLSLNLFIKGVPKFLREILSEISKKSNKSISNPFFRGLYLPNSISEDDRV